MSPLDRPIRVGLVGCGTQGRVHLRALRELGPELVAVAGLCDLDEERLGKAGDDWPAARRSRDFAGLLAHGDLDLAILCTMPNTHARIAVAALQAGAHVLVEKPLAMNGVEALTILDAAEERGLQVQLGTNMRYMPHCQYLRHAVSTGLIGDALQCRVWASHLNPPWWGPNYNKATSSGGVLASTLVHPLDLALWTCGYPEPATVSASAHRAFPAKRGPLAAAHVHEGYDAEDLFAAHARCARGLTLLIEGNWCDDTGDRSGFELVGTRGTVRSAPFEVFVEKDDGQVESHAPDLRGTEFARRRRAALTDQARPPQAADAEEGALQGWMRSVEEQDADVIEHIRRGGRWSMQDRRQLLILQRLLDACYESARLGREVTLSG